jgi:hypothetical protein
MMVGKGRQVKFWRFDRDQTQAVVRAPLAGLRINPAISQAVALDIVTDEGLIQEWLIYMSRNL